MKPTIGRIVHYNDHGTTLPAIITAVHANGLVNLKIFEDGHSTQSWKQSVPQANSTAEHGAWRWPEKV